MVYSIEEERKLLEKKLKSLGIILNRNYFSAHKGLHPLLSIPLSFSPIYYVFIIKFCYLVFTNDQLILLFSDFSKPEKEDHIQKINYSQVNDFTLTKYIKYDCIQFTYDGQPYYFYTDYDNWTHYYLGSNYSIDNFLNLKEQNFMGLLKS